MKLPVVWRVGEGGGTLVRVNVLASCIFGISESPELNGPDQMLAHSRITKIIVCAISSYPLFVSCR